MSDQDAPPAFNAQTRTAPLVHQLPAQVALDVSEAHSNVARRISNAEVQGRQRLTSEEAKERPPNGARHRRKLWLAERARHLKESDYFGWY